MLLFSFIRDIVFCKKGDLLDNPDAESEFQPYMMQRWLSMHSPELAKIINLTTNRLWSIYETKQEWYKDFLTFIPKTYNKKIKYIKKKKETVDKEEQELITFLAKSKELSKREINLYISEFNIDTEQLKKALKK